MGEDTEARSRGVNQERGGGGKGGLHGDLKGGLDRL